MLILDIRQRRAETANAAKSAFLANMSDEIRTPLGAITGMAYLIRRSQVTLQQAGWLTKLELAAKHLLGLVNAVQDLSTTSGHLRGLFRHCRVTQGPQLPLALPSRRGSAPPA